MKVIALEEHFWTPGIRAAVLALPSDQRDVNVDLWADKVAEPLLDLGDRRLQWMDEAGIDIAVLSVATPGTQSLAPALAVRLAAEANDTLAAAVAAHPTRYRGFATLPTPDPKAAAAELERAVRSLGFCGAMINGRTGDKYLDHPDFVPLFEVAAGLGVPVYIHPQCPPAAVRQAYYAGFGPAVDAVLATAGWGWHVETSVHALRMILAGLFDRLPALQIVLGHWGELLPFFLDRVNVLSFAARALKRPVADYFRRHFHVTPSGMCSAATFRNTVEMIGVDRILYSTDYPFIPLPPATLRGFLAGLPVGDADRERIAGGNAGKLLAITGG